jgi:hypothetical protein
MPVSNGVRFFQRFDETRHSRFANSLDGVVARIADTSSPVPDDVNFDVRLPNEG